jgi:hypothetical protein
MSGGNFYSLASLVASKLSSLPETLLVDLPFPFSENPESMQKKLV